MSFWADLGRSARRNVNCSRLVRNNCAESEDRVDAERSANIYSMLQLTFAIITVALVAGSFAERMKFSAMLWFIGLWAVFVYSPIAHWVGGSDRMLNSPNTHNLIGVLDFAAALLCTRIQAQPG